MNEIKKYHIQITVKDAKPPHKGREWDFDLSAEELEKRYIAPYRRGKAIIIDGRVITWDEVHRTRVFYTKREIRNLAGIPWGMMNDVTDELIADLPGWELETVASPEQLPRPQKDTRDVFVVHGRNSTARKALFEFLRALALLPIEWSEAVSETGKASPYISEILDAAFSRAHAVVVLLTPDDEARLREQYWEEEESPNETKLTGQARPNVLFEAGMAMGRNQDRTVLVELGTLRPFSDIAGRHVIRLHDTTKSRQELAQRLRDAGCPVNLNGMDWHTAGDFGAALSLIDEKSQESTIHAVPEALIDALPEFSEDERRLLKEAALDEDGEIIKLRNGSMLRVTANNKHLCNTDSAREAAQWEQYLQNLFQCSLIEDVHGDGKIFRVTSKGFEFADGLG